MITITPDAAAHLRGLLSGQSAPPSAGLRLGVERGGCAGLQYTMKIDAPAEGDAVVEENGARVLIAPGSQDFLRGVRLDYVDSLNDAGFKIDNPNAVRSCGCGTSFETTPPPEPATT